MTVNAKCSVCGADVELQDNLKSFVEKYPERVKCKKCYAAGGANKEKAAAKASGDKETGKAVSKARDNFGEVTAELLRKSYDEVIAEFSDVLADVHEFIGGWTTSVAIAKSKK